MTFPEEERPDVAEAAHAVAQEAKDARVGDLLQPLPQPAAPVQWDG
jgi:hypothetical protein